jgi:hypothetical protein
MISPKYPVAIRVYAMTIIDNLCTKYPELRAEFIPVLQDILQVSESPGLHSRGRKILRKSNDRQPGQATDENG